MDATATIKVGEFSRGGYNRYGLKACDHDFEPDTLLKLFGISMPATDETFCKPISHARAKNSRRSRIKAVVTNQMIFQWTSPK